jgi:hypothetical protein
MPTDGSELAPVEEPGVDVPASGTQEAVEVSVPPPSGVVDAPQSSGAGAGISPSGGRVKSSPLQLSDCDGRCIAWDDQDGEDFTFLGEHSLDVYQRATVSRVSLLPFAE